MKAMLKGLMILLLLPGALHAVPDRGKGPEEDTVCNSFSLDQPLPPEQRQQVLAYADQWGSHYRNIRREKSHYLQFISGLLLKYGLPDELKLIPVIESHFRQDAVSVDGACGVWQLMPEVARENNLSLMPYDDRRDVYKSSYVALKLVSDLHRRFGNNLMVVAAYNCGPQRVRDCVERSGGSRDYWAIHSLLPRETQAHVLKYLAALSVFYDRPLQPLRQEQGPGYGQPREKNGMASIQLTSSFREQAILKYLPIDTLRFRKLNPDINARLDRDGIYELRLPEKDMLLFLVNKYHILKYSMALRSGASLSK